MKNLDIKSICAYVEKKQHSQFMISIHLKYTIKMM